jgi:flagellar basal body P-ring protein FlgI
MIDYKKEVEKCQKKRLNKDIPNASKEHAKLLFKNMFKESKDRQQNIKIVSGHLNNTFYKEYAADAKIILDAGQTIDVIVVDENINIEKNDFAKVIKAHKNGTLRLGVQIEMAPHYIVVGDYCYRIEDDHEATIATANFNNPTMGQFLNSFYQDMQENTEIAA